MSNETELLQKARTLTEKASEKTGFVKYKGTSEGSPFYALYEQVIKIAELAAFTELRQGNSEEEAIESASKVIKRSMK